MADGYIPVNPGDLPIDSVALDDSLIYDVMLDKATFPIKKDKNDYLFVGVSCVVDGGDFDGKTVNLNYLPLPVPVTEDMKKSDRVKAIDKSVPFGRFCRSFGITEVVSVPKSISDQDGQRALQDWFERQYGKRGKAQIQNQEYPENSGRMRSGIRDFVI